MMVEWRQQWLEQQLRVHTSQSHTQEAEKADMPPPGGHTSLFSPDSLQLGAKYSHDHDYGGHLVQTTTADN